MANLKTLKPFGTRSADEEFEIRSRGGKKSARNRKLRAELKKNLQIILDLPVSDKNKDALLTLGMKGEETSNMSVIAASLFKEAATGNVRAIELIATGIEESEARIKKLEAEVTKYKEEIKLLKAEVKVKKENKIDELTKLDELLKGIDRMAKDETDG